MCHAHTNKVFVFHFPVTERITTETVEGAGESGVLNGLRKETLKYHLSSDFLMSICRKL